MPGQVQVAPSTRARLGDAFPLERRTLSVKGKGSMATYLVDPATAPRVSRHRTASPVLPEAGDATASGVVVGERGAAAI